MTNAPFALSAGHANKLSLAFQSIIAAIQTANAETWGIFAAAIVMAPDSHRDAALEMWRPSHICPSVPYFHR